MLVEHQTISADLAVKRELLPPYPVAEDPRPDLALDHEPWQQLLNLAYGVHGALNRESFFWVVQGLRCMGTGLMKDADGWRLVPGENQDYDADKAKYLRPNKELIIHLLDLMNAISE